jgi:hypothetical protein
MGKYGARVIQMRGFTQIIIQNPFDPRAIVLAFLQI